MFAKSFEQDLAFFKAEQKRITESLSDEDLVNHPKTVAKLGELNSHILELEQKIQNFYHSSADE